MVREIKLSDKEEWEVLYRGYADFYKVEMKDEILKTVWSWLHDRNHDVKGIVYEYDNKVIGLAHYRRMPRPLRGKYIGFLDDIYVEPKYRGKKIGEKLIHELKEISKKNNWDLVRWVTHNDNIRAKSLYDRIAKKTTWDLYELK
jgi:ribosomal protein S18 acetylase RimI-like enzyme